MRPPGHFGEGPNGLESQKGCKIAIFQRKITQKKYKKALQSAGPSRILFLMHDESAIGGPKDPGAKQEEVMNKVTGITLNMDAKTKAALIALLQGDAKTIDPMVLTNLRTATEEANKSIRDAEQADKDRRIDEVKSAFAMAWEVVAKEFAGATGMKFAKDGDEETFRIVRGDDVIVRVGKGGKDTKESRKERRDRRKAEKEAKAAAAKAAGVKAEKGKGAKAA